MNTADITALITGITALIGTVTGLITLIVHIKNHQPIPDGNPVNPPAKPGIISPTKNGWQ